MHIIICVLYILHVCVYVHTILQDKYTIVHKIHICTYLCTYICTKYIQTHTGWDIFSIAVQIIAHICTYHMCNICTVTLLHIWYISQCIFVHINVGQRLEAALLPRLLGKNPRSHHKSTTSRARTGDVHLQIYDYASYIYQMYLYVSLYKYMYQLHTN